MAREDRSWFTSCDWNQAAQEGFWKKLKQARRIRVRAAREKSAQLWYVGLKQEARDVLRRAEELGPPELRIQLEEQWARFALDDGDIGTAEAYYRKEVADATDTIYVSGRKLNLALVLARSTDPEKRREAQDLLGDWYRGDLDEVLDWNSARDLVLDKPDLDLNTLAETLVMVHFNHHQDPRLANLDADIEGTLENRHVESVAALDAYHRVLDMPALVSGIIQPNHPRWRFRKEYLFEHYLPALGAFLAEVLERCYGGVFHRAKPLGRSTVTIEKRVIHPFRHAFEVVYYHHSCIDLFSGIAPGSKKKATPERAEKRRAR